MKTPEILVIHFFEEDENYTKDTYSFSLRDTYIPNGCENCGAHKGACFELRLIYLILYWNRTSDETQFLCRKCFFEAEGVIISGTH